MWWKSHAFGLAAMGLGLMSTLEAEGAKAIRANASANACAVAFRPQFDLDTRQFIGFEARSPWQHDQQENLSASLFVAQCATSIGLWRSLGFDIDLHLTLRAEHILDPRFATQAFEAVHAHGALHDWFILYAKENDLAVLGARAFEGLLGLKRLGFQIGLETQGLPRVALDKHARALFNHLTCPASHISALQAAVKTGEEALDNALVRRVYAARAANIVLVACDHQNQADMGFLEQLGFSQFHDDSVGVPMDTAQVPHLLVNGTGPGFKPTRAHNLLEAQSSSLTPIIFDPVSNDDRRHADNAKVA
jgi:predicted signal transduction protein with EAL and GGDEF domain